MAEKKEGFLSAFLKDNLIKIAILIVFLIFPIFALLLIPGYKVSDGFKTLQEIEAYAKYFDEKSITMENSNLDKPDYTAFYKSQKIGFFASKFKRLASFFGIGKGLPWGVLTYKNLLEKLLEAGKAKNYTGTFVLKVNATQNTKIVVWGDVQGAFHSLSRNLRELVKLGIIDENLKVTNPDYYLIFMGDVISRSAFIMETVSVVARLILNNPENVFYIRGNHESSNYWNGKGLERELKIRARSLDKNAETPLEKLTNDFFDTLPAIVYFGALPDQTIQFLRISHEGADGESKIAEINDSKLSPFLSTKSTNKVSLFNYKDIKEDASGPQIEIKAILKAEIKRKTYQAMDGLRLTSPENGVTAWTMLSCPTETYQKGLEYFFDAFSIIQAGAKIEDWTITLHSQDVRTLSGFKERKHNLISGQNLDGTQPVQAQAPAPTPTVQPTATNQATQVPQAASTQNSAPAPVPAQSPQTVPPSAPTSQAQVPAPTTPVTNAPTQATNLTTPQTSAPTAAQNPAQTSASPIAAATPAAVPLQTTQAAQTATTAPQQAVIPAATTTQPTTTSSSAPLPVPVPQTPAQTQAVATTPSAVQALPTPSSVQGSTQTQSLTTPVAPVTAVQTPAPSVQMNQVPQAVASVQNPATSAPVQSAQNQQIQAPQSPTPPAVTTTSTQMPPAPTNPPAQTTTSAASSPAPTPAAPTTTVQNPSPIPAPAANQGPTTGQEITFKPYKES